MRLINGVHLYEDEEFVPPPGLPQLPDIQSKFGIKISETDGQKAWVESSEEDFRALKKKMGLSEDEVESELKQHLAGNCSYNGHNGCSGGCHENSVCVAQYSPVEPTHVIFCGCGGGTYSLPMHEGITVVVILRGPTPRTLNFLDLFDESVLYGRDALCFPNMRMGLSLKTAEYNGEGGFKYSGGILPGWVEVRGLRRGQTVEIE